MTKEDIVKLVNSPKLLDLMPKNFNSDEEADHLYSLIENCEGLRSYCFEEFICSGGSGMVFKAKRSANDDFSTAIKIVRKKVYETNGESPFSSEELEALKELSHPNIVRLYDTVKYNGNVVAVCTSYIDNAQGIDLYIQDILNQVPNSNQYKTPFSQISIERLESTCEAIVVWIYEIAQAIAHMHRQGYYHLDIKPANILMQGTGKQVHPIITDMGSCMKKSDAQKKRIHFTWAYAHPDLTDISTGNPGSIEGGALRASANISELEKLPIYDLYALGKTIQQILAVVDLHFGEACYSSYAFRYLHIISALLLDGRNRIEGTQQTPNTYLQHGITFVTPFPMGLSDTLLGVKKIMSAQELVQRLKRYNKDYSIIELAPEFNPRCPTVINNTVGEVVPFTIRVSKVFNHPTMKRLYYEPQLGLMTEIYPGASHNRWSHSLGVFAILVKYYVSLLSDPDNPLMRIIINKEDINHAFLAAIMHDIGQTSICHDLETVNNKIFNHLTYILRLVREKPSQSEDSLEKVIYEYWGKNSVDLERIVNIINHSSPDPIDGVASNCIDGPIDADKLDYIKRDSYYCGVAYGDGIDYGRIMNSITVTEKDKQLRLAYYTKGRTAISSMLLARYQLYGSVYWHHTYRCLHSMLYYAAQLVFGSSDGNCEIHINKSKVIGLKEIQALYFYRVLCKYPWEESWAKIGYANYSYLSSELKSKMKNSLFPNDYALDFVYVFTNKEGCYFLSQLKKRVIYKRIFTQTMKGIEISELTQKCSNRIEVSQKIQEKLLEAINARKVVSARKETSAEIYIVQELEKLEESLEKGNIVIIVDFPQKINIPPRSWPREIDDSARKLQNYGGNDSHEIVEASNRLLSEVASIRIYAEPQFYSLVTRYLPVTTIESCVRNVLEV